MAHQVGERLKQLMARLGIDETRLATETKVAKANISRLRNDPHANPTLATLKPLADFFGISVSQLLGEAPLNTAGDGVVPNCRVPLLAWTQVSAFLEGKLAMHYQWVSTELEVTNNAFALKIVDKTMGPLFPVDAVVIIDRQPAYQEGMHVLICDAQLETPYLRQLIIEGNVRLLKSLKVGSHWVEAMNKAHTIVGTAIEVRYQFGHHQPMLNELAPAETATDILAELN